jgi:hypothetical protein
VLVYTVANVWQFEHKKVPNEAADWPVVTDTLYIGTAR